VYARRICALMVPAPETEADEYRELQQRLNAKQAESESLEATLVKAISDKEAAHEAGRAGIRAAKGHMDQLRGELGAVRRWRDAQARDGPTGAEPTEEDEERKTHAKAKQTELRGLRHELQRWKHQVEITEAKWPRQEDEIVRLKAELQHTLDILQSTQHAVKHHEVERDFANQASSPSPEQGGDPGDVPLSGGGHGCIEAHAERVIREDIEGKNVRLSGKAKRLSGVVAAQQLLIQRLEKQVLQEERELDQKDEHLYHQSGRVAQLKSLTRKRSDSHVAKMLGVAAVQPNQRKVGSTTSSVSLDIAKSASLSQLPEGYQLPPI